MARVNPFHPLDICWDWSKICDCTGINGEKNTLAQQTRSFTLSDPTDGLDKINMSWDLLSVHSPTLSFSMRGWGLSQTMRVKCYLWTWNFNFQPTKGHSLIGHPKFRERTTGALLPLLLDLFYVPFWGRTHWVFRGGVVWSIRHMSLLPGLALGHLWKNLIKLPLFSLLNKF